MEIIMYKITATIIKPGGMPAEWVRFSKEKLTKGQCEKLLFRAKEAGKSFGEKISLDNFKCVREKPGVRLTDEAGG
ncbi:hypothetical protein BTJ39_22505 [Izhakiella australiensis]|uniref:DUF1187 family protein n=1 Tax=Izhakiella australiensis TaxID=1926881 RepID=A0A1S8Y8W4_9GAMM|nr:DUF1187 family protein [Izhakiella australiensis]OON35559.1 hypothetical protein BTJ39_22505 [Izhakiella australiensis]